MHTHRHIQIAGYTITQTDRHRQTYIHNSTAEIYAHTHRDIRTTVQPAILSHRQTQTYIHNSRDICTYTQRHTDNSTAGHTVTHTDRHRQIYIHNITIEIYTYTYRQ